MSGPIAAYIGASVVMLAALLAVVLFLRRRRQPRLSADGQPVGPTTRRHGAPPRRRHEPASDVGLATFDATFVSPVPAGSAARLRRRDVIPAIRVAEESDLVRLNEIEDQSDPGLEGSGLGALPAPALREADAPTSVLLVAGRPAVAYIRLDEVDGLAHVDQLAVLPAVARQGIGRALLDAAVAWAAQQGYPAMTLSTFAESEWNSRVYDPIGFRAVGELTPGLLELRDWERAIGLDAIGTRVVMRRELPA